jgi:tetratricopeptide (TPR) repeat protein
MKEQQASPPHAAARSWLILLAAATLFAAATHARNGEWRDGITLWEQVTREGYRKARGFFNLGVNYHRHGRLADAIASYTTSLAIDPGHVNAYTNRGNAYDDMGRPQDALADYQRALQLSPSDDYLYYNLGITYRRVGREQEALSHFQRSCELGNEQACVVWQQQEKDQKTKKQEIRLHPSGQLRVD